MKLRPEFELLDDYFRRLYYHMDVDRELLLKIKDHIKLCEHIAEADYEKAILFRTTHWWRKKAQMLGLYMSGHEMPALPPGDPTSSPNDPDKKFELTANDKRFLRSLRIGVGDSENDEAVE